MKNRRLCDWDSNPSQQDGKRWIIHWAMWHHIFSSWLFMNPLYLFESLPTPAQICPPVHQRAECFHPKQSITLSCQKNFATLCLPFAVSLSFSPSCLHSFKKNLKYKVLSSRSGWNLLFSYNNLITMAAMVLRGYFVSWHVLFTKPKVRRNNVLSEASNCKFQQLEANGLPSEPQSPSNL